jgi:23S rRNA pseudouridine1911/1915/1917 synthase
MTESLERSIAESLRGQRLDQALAAVFPEYSRSRLKNWLDQGRVLVDGVVLRPRDRVIGGEWVRLTPELVANTSVEAEDIPIDVRYEDEHVLVVYKPAGLVVHPGAGNAGATLQNALLGFDARLNQLPRAGLVHRIDKDTSGLLVVARSIQAHTELVRALGAHEIKRQYQAIVNGVMTAGGTVDAPLDRHRTDRLRQAVRMHGREAITHYRVIQRYRAHTHIRLQLETGRTHQIRVHMEHIGFPLVGDPLYGRRLLLPKQADESLISLLKNFKRQALHAAELEFKHPMGEHVVNVKAELPEDYATLIKGLDADLKRQAVRD